MRVSLSSQLLRSRAWAWSRPILRTPQRTSPWTARPASQSARTGSGSETRFKGRLQGEPAFLMETKTTGAARKTRPRRAINLTRVLSQGKYGKKNAKADKKATPEPSPVNLPSWSRFDIARSPNRTPLPRHQEPPRAHEKAHGSADWPSGAVRGPGGRPLPFRGKAGVAPPRNACGTEECIGSPFSSGIPARAPFRPLNLRTDDSPQETQDDSTSVHSGYSRFTPSSKPMAKIVKPDALRYEPTNYKDPATSKYLAAKERFKPSVKKDWSTPQELSRENWLPRNTLNTRPESPSTSVDPGNVMYKHNLPGPNAVTDTPAQMEVGTRREGPWEGREPDDQAEGVNPPPDEETTETPPAPRLASPGRVRRAAKRRLQLIERERQSLCVKHGVDPDTSRRSHEGGIQEALERFIRSYDTKAARREAKKMEKRTRKRKVKASVARKASAHREETR